MRDFKMLVIGMLLGLLLSFVVGFNSIESTSGRYQAILTHNSVGLIIVDTDTGTAKLVKGAQTLETQWGKTFEEMAPMPTQKQSK